MFWGDGEVMNSFDRMFDFNRDGNLDPVEQAMQYEFFEESTKEDSAEEDNPLYSDIDLDELEDMDENERREALEEAGYEPEDFDEI